MQKTLLFQRVGKQVEPPPSQIAEVGDTKPSENRHHVFDRETNIRFLVDSGSVISLLPKKLYESKELNPQPPMLSAANSSPIATFGTRMLTLDLGIRRPAGWCFTVANVQSAIIGADFLAHYGYFVDLKGRRLIDPTT